MTVYIGRLLVLIVLCSFIEGRQHSKRTRFEDTYNAILAETSSLARNKRSLSPVLKTVLKGTKYVGIKSRTKLYNKLGGKTQAITDFYALKPYEVVIHNTGYMMGKVGDRYAHLNLKPPVVLLLQGEKYFRQIRYKVGDKLF